MRRRREPKHAEPVRVGAVMLAVYPSDEPEDVRTLRAFSWWERVVPARVAENARPVRLDPRGVLWVHTSSAVWASELEFLREQLLAAVQRDVAAAGVRNLRFRPGPLPPLPPRMVMPRPVPRVPLHELPEEIAAALSRIADDGVRASVAEAAAVSLGAPARKDGRR